MKKKIILILLFVSFLLYTQPIEAARSTIDIKIPKIPEIKITIPSWFNSAIQPLQDSIQDLKAKVENLQNKVIEIEKRLANLNGNQNGEDFDLPQEWKVEFYQTMPGDVTVNGSDGCTEISCPLYPGTRIKISTENSHCAWRGMNIDSLVTTRMIGYLPKEAYGIGICKEMTFDNISNLPESGKSFDVDIKFFWQGVSKEKKISVTVPSRPFPDNSTLPH